jgi:manganese/zinc/iron transport system permease protein
LFGETAGMRSSDIHLLVYTAVVTLLVVIALYKEFKLLSFDPEFAAAQGWPTLWLDLLMMGTLTVVTIVGLPICGVILMAALIILPGAAARFWSDRLGPLLMIAAVAGGAAGVVGTLVASPLPERWLGFEPLGVRGLPPGPLIVLSATTFFLLSLFFAPRRGIVARTWAELRLRMRIAREHLLRALYELSENRLPERPYVEEAQIVAHRSWSKWVVDWWLRRAEGRGLVERQQTAIRLTPRGLVAAAEVTKTHRLWELFLVESAGVASDHVDRDADAVEHMLPRPLVEDLERRLAEAGQLPAVPKSVPQSPHELTG